MSIKCCDLLRDSDLPPYLPLIQIPPLIVHGDSDQVCAYELAEQTHAAIAGSRLVTVDKAGHGLIYEKRDVLNEQLRLFAEIGKRLEAEAQAPQSR